MLITATSEHLQSGRRETKRRARGNGKSPRTPRGGAGDLSQKDTRRVAAFRGAGSHHVAHVRPPLRPGPRFSCDPARYTTATIKRMFPRAERPDRREPARPVSGRRTVRCGQGSYDRNPEQKGKGSKGNGAGEESQPLGRAATTSVCPTRY